MSFLYNCGLCCALTSAWGVIQLFIMGIIFYVEAVTFIEEAEAEEYEDYEDFIKKTKSNYKSAAINCWVCALFYLVTLALSYTCLLKAKKQAKMEAMKQEDDELACAPPVVPPTSPKKIL